MGSISAAQNFFQTETREAPPLSVTILPCAPPPAGLVAWWPADLAANDLLNGNNGTLLGGVGFRAGKVGQAFSFDGISTSISISNSPSMDFGTGDFTIEGWIQFDSLIGGSDGAQEIIQKSVGIIPNNQSYFLEYDGPPENSLRFMVGDQANRNDLFAPVTLVTQRWYHVAAVRQANTSRLFLDGHLVKSQTAGNSVNTGIGGVAQIGNIVSNSFGITRHFAGAIDDLSLYNRALSGSEIQDIFNSEYLGKCQTRTPLYVTVQGSGSVVKSPEQLL